MGKELFQPFGKRSLLERYSRLCPSLSERIGRAKTGTLQKRLCIESSPPTPASWGTESRLRFLNFTTFRTAVYTADSANSPARVKPGGRQGSVVGRGRLTRSALTEAGPGNNSCPNSPLFLRHLFRDLGLGHDPDTVLYVQRQKKERIEKI